VRVTNSTPDSPQTARSNRARNPSQVPFTMNQPIEAQNLRPTQSPPRFDSSATLQALRPITGPQAKS
jgi:hypothetical protein